MSLMTEASTCSIDGCPTPADARGWCRKHYMRWRRHGDPTTTLQHMEGPHPVCAVSGCGRDSHGKAEYCGMHLQRVNRHGDPDTTLRIRAARRQA